MRRLLISLASRRFGVSDIFGLPASSGSTSTKDAGALAFSRTGNANTGDFGYAFIPKQHAISLQHLIA